jgi:hypothetical protein
MDRRGGVIGAGTLGAAALLAALAVDAPAYRADPNIVPQPILRWYTSLNDWRKPFGRVVRALNRADIGTRLVRAKIPERASIQIGRLRTRCGYPGVQGVTQSIAGGYAAIYLPYGCHGTAASIVAAHELGHALGLLHENRACALMNSSATGDKLIPTHCLGLGYDWYRKPFRLDDLRGLRRLYRNTAPLVTLALGNPGQRAVAGRPVRFDREVADRERNISEVRIDFGDGEVFTGYELRELPGSHAYAEPGTFTVALRATDYYGRQTTRRLTIEVEG